MIDFYAVLGIDRTATPQQVKAAYRRLVKVHHPDRGGDADRFKQVNEAYETLIDPVRRARYDRPPPPPPPKRRPSSRSPANRSRVIDVDRGDVDLWAQTQGVWDRSRYWREYERRKPLYAYEEPDKFWKDLNDWWAEQTGGRPAPIK